MSVLVLREKDRHLCPSMHVSTHAAPHWQCDKTSSAQTRRLTCVKPLVLVNCGLLMAVVLLDSVRPADLLNEHRVGHTSVLLCKVNTQVSKHNC